MTMHLDNRLTTTSTKKRQVKITKAQQEQLERDWRDRNQRLKQMGLRKETYEQFLEWVYGKGKKETSKKHNKSKSGPVSPLTTNKTYADKSQGSILGAPSHTTTPSSGSCTKKPPQTYTGENVIGIAVMHKSCLQPIFSQEQAVESAHMRR